ncbi:MAG: DNA repair protein RecN [Acidobacteriota bacterium]
MLTDLRVRNLVVLQDVEVVLGPGLNVLTGETGAGKSILVDAVGLLLGDRAHPELVRKGESCAVVEGLFQVEDDGLQALLQESGLEPCEDNTLVVRREIRPDGAPNRVFINGTLAPLGVLRKVMAGQLALHGQNHHLTLASQAAQRSFLDRSCVPPEQLKSLGKAWRDLQSAAERRVDHQRRRSETEQRQADLREQLQEIQSVAPQPEEETELRARERLLATVRERRELAGEVVGILDEEDTSVVAGLARARARLERLCGLDGRLDGALEQLTDASYAIQDAIRAVQDAMPEGETDAGELETVQARLAVLQKLRRKHGGRLEDVLDLADRLESELDGLEHDQDLAGELLQQEKTAAAAYHRQALDVGSRRRQGGRRLAAHLARELPRLGLPGARVVLHVASSPGADPDDPVSILAAGGPSGYEKVDFLFAANPGEDLRSLSQVASGGELSRLLLALHLLGRGGGGKNGAQTFIFDEIDAGIGGNTARLIGDRLRQTAARYQVICVTHLPQIAAVAHHHLRVAKEIAGGRARTAIQRLAGSQRVEEVARMLGGDGAPGTARRHARALLGVRSGPLTGPAVHGRVKGARRTVRKKRGTPCA